MSKNEWFVDWFDTDYYHMLYQNRDEKEAERFIENIIAYLNLPNGAKIIDLACGKGRHAKILSDYGYDVLGVDLSPNSIKKAAEMGHEKLRFNTHDMRNEIKDEKFDAVFNLFTSFGYFEHEGENQKVCSSIAKMLNHRGLLLIDFLNAEKVISNLVQEETRTVDHVHFSINRHADVQHIYKKIKVEDLGKTFEFMERVQALHLRDFESLLNADFEIISTFGTYDLSPFQPSTSDRLIILAQLKQ